MDVIVKPFCDWRTLSTTRERVRQIQVEALRLLRRMVESGRIPADVAILD